MLYLLAIIISLIVVVKVKSKKVAALIGVALVIFAGFITENGGSATKQSSSNLSRNSYANSSSYSDIPECPPVNREQALTREEAEKLRGTGYHNYRPGSSGENLALRAAQVVCKNCWYHSDNGSNSLCDYCAWMKEYGGGLPTEINLQFKDR